jgi:cytochrome c oxidase assembly protein subunit 15
MARISPKTYRIVCGVAFSSLCIIVFTGALVRLTGSGLGCVDWPQCSQSKFIDVSSGHTLIEQANRLFTGVVSFSVIAAVLLSHLSTPKRKDLIVLSWSLVLGVIAQIVIGGVVVLTGLNPFANMAHFLVSMVLVATSFTLMRRSSLPQATPIFRSEALTRRPLVHMLMGMTVLTLSTGTVVTATGPHAGNEDAVRFGFALSSVARVHSLSMLVTLGVLILLLVKTRRGVASPALRDAMQSLLFATLLQAAVGYTQYFTKVPATLVAVHIVGALFFFVATLNIIVQPSA